MLGDRPGVGIQAADPVAALHREPDDAPLVDDQCMRVAARRQLVFYYPARGGIQAADGAVAVSCVPDLAALIHEEAMGLRPGRQTPLCECLLG